MKELHDEGLSIARLILRSGKDTPHEAWAQSFQKFFEDLRRFKQPLGHGTVSDYLEGILAHGLGAYKPPKAFSPTVTSMCDLHKTDGVIACYAFATRNKTDMLAVDATKITGRDIVARYAEVNPLFKAWWRRFLLRVIAWLYNRRRGKPSGFPVLLVYEGSGEAECEYRNKNIPSEVNCRTVLISNALRYIFVPAEHVSKTYELLHGYAICTIVLPIELFELQEIFDNK